MSGDRVRSLIVLQDLGQRIKKFWKLLANELFQFDEWCDLEKTEELRVTDVR